jgi:hypothetical protein
MTREQRAWWRRYNRYLASAEWQRIRAERCGTTGIGARAVGARAAEAIRCRPTTSPIEPTITPGKRHCGTLYLKIGDCCRNNWVHLTAPRRVSNSLARVRDVTGPASVSN